MIDRKEIETLMRKHTTIMTPFILDGAVAVAEMVAGEKDKEIAELEEALEKRFNEVYDLTAANMELERKLRERNE